MVPKLNRSQAPKWQRGDTKSWTRALTTTMVANFDQTLTLVQLCTWEVGFLWFPLTRAYPCAPSRGAHYNESLIHFLAQPEIGARQKSCFLSFNGIIYTSPSPLGGPLFHCLGKAVKIASVACRNREEGNQYLGSRNYQEDNSLSKEPQVCNNPLFEAQQFIPSQISSIYKTCGCLHLGVEQNQNGNFLQEILVFAWRLLETRLSYNCAHLRSTKESVTIWVKIFWVKIFWD